MGVVLASPAAHNPPTVRCRRAMKIWMTPDVPRLAVESYRVFWAGYWELRRRRRRESNDGR